MLCLPFHDAEAPLFDDIDIRLLSKTKVDHLTGLLRRCIRGGELLPGDRLPSERDLAASLLVSRDVVRDALDRLTVEGYLTVRRGRNGGAVVGDLALPACRWFQSMRDRLEEFEELFDVRVALETRTAALAAQHRDDEDLVRMQAAIDLFRLEDWRDTFRRSNWQFHDAVAKASRSRLLERSAREIRGRMWLPPDRVFYERQVIDITEMHRRVFHLIRDRDSAGASDAMLTHLEQGRLEIRLMIMMGAEHPPPGVVIAPIPAGDAE